MSIVTVFDTNVWVSYFLNRQLEELVALKYDRDICFVRSADTLRELQLVLARPKFVKYFDLPIADYIEFYCNLTEDKYIKPMFKGCRDANDNFIFDLAIQSKAQYLVSGDKDILEIKSSLLPTLKILTLATFKSIVVAH